MFSYVSSEDVRDRPPQQKYLDKKKVANVRTLRSGVEVETCHGELQGQQRPPACAHCKKRISDKRFIRITRTGQSHRALAFHIDECFPIVFTEIMKAYVTYKRKEDNNGSDIDE